MSAYLDLCFYWCFYHKYNVAKTWHERNNCNKFTYTLLMTFVLFLGMGGLFVIFGCVLMLLGWIRDVVLSDNACIGMRNHLQFTECFVGGLSVIGLYLINLLLNVFEVGPILVAGLVTIGKISNERLRMGIFILGCTVTFWIPILLNPVLGLLHRWCGVIPFEPFHEMKCQLGNFSHSINFGCSLEGVYPFGLGLMGINLMVIICGFSIIALRRCIVETIEEREEARVTEKLLKRTSLRI